MVIKKLVELMHLNTSIEICSTQRETDGLAMSSRNLRLTPAARQSAPLIFQTLSSISSSIEPGDISTLKKQAEETLTLGGFKVDYVEIAAANDLTLIQQWDGHTPLIALAAAFIDGVRLIDNLLL